MAQSVEHIVHIDGVTGSSPVATTMSKLGKLLVGLFLFPRFFIVHTDGGSKPPPAVRDSGGVERFESCFVRHIQSGKLLAGLFLFPRFFIVHTDGGSKPPLAVRDSGGFERFEPVATTTNPCSIKLARVFSCLEKMKIFILDRRKRTESITLFTSKNR